MEGATIFPTQANLEGTQDEGENLDHSYLIDPLSGPDQTCWWPLSIGANSTTGIGLEHDCFSLTTMSRENRTGESKLLKTISRGVS